MGKPKDDWWPSARSAIRAYPRRKQRLNELRRTGTTPQYGPSGGRGGPSDPVHAAATRELPPRQQVELEAVEWAIEQTRALPDGERRLKMIDLYYFRQTHKLFGAGMEAGYSEPTAKRINGAFVHLVGKKLGYC